MEHPKLIVKKGSQGAIVARHPWLLSTSIVESKESIEDGQIVDLVEADQRFLARGIYNSRSRIRVRAYSWDPSIELDESLFSQRLERAFELRLRSSAGSPLEAQRLVFSEADQWSGLIVDRYADWIVIQQTARAITPWIPMIVERLVARYHSKGIVLRIDEKTAQSEGIEPCHRVLHGEIPSVPIEIEENGLRWTVDLNEGQKTGYYLDQRDNRREAADWVPEGGRVLDVCCYVGGFALTMARWSQAAEIVAVDTSERAIDAARGHAKLNGLDDRIQFEVNDFYKTLEQRADRGERFETIVLDPPKMAGSRMQIDAALRAYHRLNYMATKLLVPGGILITCSCSGRVTRMDFHQMLLGVSKRSGREIQILAQRGAAVDHPSCVTCPETDYLKCFICRVL